MTRGEDGEVGRAPFIHPHIHPTVQAVLYEHLPHSGPEPGTGDSAMTDTTDVPVLVKPMV